MRLVVLGLVLVYVGFEEALGVTSNPYICLDISPELPACNFQWSHRKTAERRISSAEKEDDALNDLPQDQVGVTIIYQLTGCIPSRLPFTLPNCKTEDLHGRLVQVQRIVPFMIKSKEDEPFEPPFIFPQVERAQWLRLSENHRDELFPRQKVRQNVQSDDMPGATLVKLIKRRKKMLSENLLRKSRKYSRLSEETLKGTDREIISIFPLIPDDVSGMKVYESKYQQHWNEVDSDESPKKNHRRSRSDSTNWGIEFPYGEAIPFDPEKHWMLLHRRPEDDKTNREGSSVVPEEREVEKESENKPKKLKKRLIEFPYSKAIPFDPKKHSMLLNKLENHHEISLLPLTSLTSRMAANTDERTNSLDWDVLDR